MTASSPAIRVCAYLFVLAGIGLAGGAQASTLYRCTGSQGEVVYSTDRTGYTDCKQLGNFAAPTAPEPASTAGSEPRVDFRSAPAGNSVTPATPAAGSRVTRGAVYKYEKDGVTHYTNHSPGKSAKAQLLFSYIETCYACGLAPGIDWSLVPLNLTAYTAEVDTAAMLAGVDPSLVRAIMHAESAFNPRAKSHVGAQGLMQLMPGTATRFGVKDAYVPSENIAGGSQYLAWLMNRFDNDVTKVSAAYNAGEGAVDRHGGIPPYEETQRFVERVGILFLRYQQARASAGATGTSAGSR